MRGFVSEMGRVNRMLEEMAVAALVGACLAVVNQAKLEARGGFKSGRFVTRGWQSITYEVAGAPRFSAKVGSTEKHFAFWELGHRNLFTGQFERNRWLTRGMERSRGQQRVNAVKAAEQVAKKYGVIGQYAFARGKRLFLASEAATIPGPRPRLP